MGPCSILLLGGLGRLGRRGAVLPVALFLVVGLSALTTSVFLLARGEGLLAAGDLRYLTARVSAERALTREPVTGSDPDDASAGGEGIEARPLGQGFILIRPSGVADRPAPLSVRWILNPDSVAMTFPGAAEVGHLSMTSGVRFAEADCGNEPTTGLVRLRVSEPVGTPHLPDPPSPGPPRLGILGLEQLMELPALDLTSAGGFPDGTGGGVLRAAPGVVISTGAGEGVLLASGDLRLEGVTYFRGVVVAAGSVELGDQASIEGVVLAGGAVRIAGDAYLAGCRGSARDALDHADLRGPHPVPAGELLGRF